MENISKKEILRLARAKFRKSINPEHKEFGYDHLVDQLLDDAITKTIESIRINQKYIMLDAPDNFRKGYQFAVDIQTERIQKFGGANFGSKKAGSIGF